MEIKLKENDEITIHGCSFKIIEVPGHTLDHMHTIQQNKMFCFVVILYFQVVVEEFLRNSKSNVESLSKLSILDLSTKIYCTHEYTQSNLNFAVKVDLVMSSR